MKRILITGGAGFIGANLSRMLASADARITVLDNLVTGFESNISGLDVSFVSGDVCSFDFSSLERPDEIFHLACPASPGNYQKRPIDTLDTCYIGTRRVLDFAGASGSRVVFSSTSEVYGDPMISPQRESYNGNVGTQTIRACYDEGKRVAETLCFEYRRMGVDVRVARIFNTYGPLMDSDDGRVVSNFICQALSGGPITIYGAGSQTRSFCYVDDTVRGLLALMALDELDAGAVNIGNDDEITIQQLAESVLVLVGGNPGLEYRALPDADPKSRRPCLERASTLMGWGAEVSLDEGLRMTIDYFRAHLAAAQGEKLQAAMAAGH